MPACVQLAEAVLIGGNLQPQSRWTKPLKAALLQATALLKKVERLAADFQNPNLLLKPLIPNERLNKNKPEDTIIMPQGNLTNLLAILNYNQAIDDSLALLKRYSFSLDFLKAIHSQILKDSPKKRVSRPGQIRDRRVVLRNSLTREVKYRAPSAEDLPDLLQRFEVFLKERSLPPLIHAAACHADFLNIHPFHDGNGRVGYLLTMVLLVERKVIPAQMLNVFVLFSYAYFHATQGAYAKVIRNNTQRQRTQWIIYFLDIISLISDEIIRRVESLHQVIRGYQATLTQASSSRLALKLIEQLSTTPWFLENQMANILNVSERSLKKTLRTLESHHILTPIVDPSNGERLYVAQELVQVIENF